MKTFWKKWKNTQTVSKNDDWKTLSKITCTSSCPHIQNHDRWPEILTYGKATRNNSAKYSLKFSYYYWFKSVVRELRAKRFEILLKHLHSECVIRISSSSTLMWGRVVILLLYRRWGWVSVSSLCALEETCDSGLSFRIASI